MVLENLSQAYNIQEIYLDKDDSCMVILAATMFKILSTQNTVKGYTPGKKLFGCDTIILIGHNEDW